MESEKTITFTMKHSDIRTANNADELKEIESKLVAGKESLVICYTVITITEE